jgi:hypothetical protein
MLGLGKPPADLLATLLSYAGSLHGMSYEAFESLCDRVGPDDGGLAGFIHARTGTPDFHKGTFEVTVADALAHGRFELVAVVGSAPTTLRQSLRYLNVSGANIALYEANLFTADTVLALQANQVDVGHQHETPTVAEMNAPGLLAVTSKNLGENAGELMMQLQKFCSSSFDEITYDGNTDEARMTARFAHADSFLDVLTAGSDGSIELRFDAIAALDPKCITRERLAEAMERMLGADLGHAKKISRLNLDLMEHLNDPSLMEMFTETLADTLLSLRGGAAPELAGAAA